LRTWYAGGCGYANVKTVVTSHSLLKEGITLKQAYNMINPQLEVHYYDGEAMARKENRIYRYVVLYVD